MAPHKTILDVLRQSRQSGEDVWRYCGERPPAGIRPVDPVRELPGVVVHDGRPGVGIHLQPQNLPELDTDGRRKDIALPGAITGHADSCCKGALSSSDFFDILRHAEARQPLFKLASKFGIPPNARAEVSRNVPPHLHPEGGGLRGWWRRRRLGVTQGSDNEHHSDGEQRARLC